MRIESLNSRINAIPQRGGISIGFVVISCTRDFFLCRFETGRRKSRMQDYFEGHDFSRFFQFYALAHLGSRYIEIFVLDELLFFNDFRVEYFWGINSGKAFYEVSEKNIHS